MSAAQGCEPNNRAQQGYEICVRHATAPLKVSFHDLARAPALARAARTELYDRQHSGVIETDVGAIEFAAHAAEIERQHAAWQAVDADAKDEARVNKARACCAATEAVMKRVLLHIHLVPIY